MKNITVSVDDETYRQARIKAAERETSISALVKRFLIELASAESGTGRLEREERELRARIHDFTAGDRVSRDDAHGG
jgi:hypothetical protein